MEINTKALERAAVSLHNAEKAVQASAADAIVTAALISERDLKDVALAGGRAQRRGLFMEGRAQFALGIRTGHAAGSVTSNVYRAGDTWVSSVGSPLDYVLRNEQGADITAKGGALAIPTVNALSPSGALNNRFSGLSSLRQARDPGGRKLFIWKGKRKGTSGAWLAGTAGPGAGTITRNAKSGRFQRGGRLVLYFLLRKTVHVPARYMFRHAARRVAPQILEATGVRIGVKVAQAVK